MSAQVEAIRRYGPLGLCVYCFLQVLLSAGDRAIYYSPAEVNFLFCGPFGPASSCSTRLRPASAQGW